MPKLMSVRDYAARINRSPRTVYNYIKAGALSATNVGLSKQVIMIVLPDDVWSDTSAIKHPGGQLWPISLYANYMGLSARRLQQLIKAGRVKGVIVLSQRTRLIHVSKAAILPNFNFPRRLDGSRIGRCKPLRGERGFVERPFKLRRWK